MFDEKYKGVTIKGSRLPDSPITNNVKISFTKEMMEKYIPTINAMELPKGIKLLCIIMAHKEGYYKGTRSFRTNNPGNIGNTDSGKNQTLKTLTDGINLQVNYLNKIITGQSKSYPLNKRVVIKPYFSQEIADNYKTYKMSPYVAGYDFVFTGQLDQFVKIYSTGARAGNSYLSMIISFFKNHGIEINETTTLQEIAKL